MQTSQKWQQFQCLNPSIIKTLQNNGFTSPTSIQSEVFQNYNHYYDFLIASQTGSGKTLAFAAPIISELINISLVTALPSKTLCLIMTPTRELSQQIQEVIDMLTKDTVIRHACILGGLSIAKQLRVINQQLPHIIIGTPGRIHQLLTQNSLTFQYLKYLILDQADRMIELGHYRELDSILNKIFETKKKQYYERDFRQISTRLDEIEEQQFYIMENGKKKKIGFDLQNWETQKLFQVPQNLFEIVGELPMVESTTQKKKQKTKSHKTNNQQQSIQAEKASLETLIKMKKKIFFISATLTRQFKGTKYYTKKNRDNNREQQPQVKEPSKNNKIDKSSQEYIPKLKALLSRVKSNIKPKIIDQSSVIFLPKKLKQQYCFTTNDIDKITTILCYINELPQNEKIIIFSNTIKASKRIKYFIDAAGLKSLILHSHMIQKHRLQKLQKFKKPSLNILISTDLAARGLDFTITHVIQYSVPINGDTYVHRIGRTARANKTGQALVLISQKDVNRWEDISETVQKSDINRKIERYCPGHVGYMAMKNKVEEFQWVRLNQQKQENKRMAALNQMQAEQFGIQVQQNHSKSKKYSKQEQRLHHQKIEREIKKIKNKNTTNNNKINIQQFGNQKKWRKNKFVMSAEEIKKYL